MIIGLQIHLKKAHGITREWVGAKDNCVSFKEFVGLVAR